MALDYASYNQTFVTNLHFFTFLLKQQMGLGVHLKRNSLHVFI